VKYDIPYYNIGVITGPCHAEEVAWSVFLILLVCGDPDKAKTVAKIYLITLKPNDDIIGTEYAACKKIFMQLLQV
jgi:glycerol-3-phosphate dehydrogenase (NAD(P)+)